MNADQQRKEIEQISLQPTVILSAAKDLLSRQRAVSEKILRSAQDDDKKFSLIRVHPRHPWQKQS